MAILANRVKTKNHLLELLGLVSFSLKRFFVIALIFVCFYLLHSPAQSLSKASLEISGHLLSVGSMISKTIVENFRFLYDRFSYFRNLEAENLRLKLQLSQLNDIETALANTLSENKELRKLLKVADGLKYNYITSRLVGVNITPVTSSAIIEAGSNSGIKLNDLVTSQDGLVGKVINVSDNYSSVMLLSDHGSRVPVVTSSSKERGILTKQGDNMLLIYLPEEHKVEVGELVYTSGDGRIYPHGILVGRVYMVTSEGVFVDLSVNLSRTEFVNILSSSLDL